jgi:hypothetical protein
MRLNVPLKGKVLSYDPAAAQLDGLGIVGDPNDPIRVDIDLGNVSWRLISIDLENDTAEIEVSPAEEVRVDPSNPENRQMRKATEAEKSQFLTHAQGVVKGKKGKLEKTNEVVELWKNNPPGVRIGI